jgi:hypothetical protein
MHWQFMVSANPQARLSCFASGEYKPAKISKNMNELASANAIGVAVEKESGVQHARRANSIKIGFNILNMMPLHIRLVAPAGKAPAHAAWRGCSRNSVPQINVRSKTTQNLCTKLPW